MKLQRKFKFDFELSSIERIRNKFLLEYKNNPAYYDKNDAKLIEVDDYWIERFLSANKGNEEISYQNLIDTFKWFKKNDFRNLTPSYFPEEFFKTGAFFIYASDRDGNLTLHFRIKYLRRIKEFKTTMELFGAYMLYTIDKQANGNGWSFIVDFADSGLINADFDICKYIIYLLKTHFPVGLTHILIVDLPWFLRTFWTMVKQWIPSDKRNLIKTTSRNELHLFIEKKNLPDYLGGDCFMPYKLNPSGCLNVYDFSLKVLKLNISTCNKIMNIYEPILNEINQLC